MEGNKKIIIYNFKMETDKDKENSDRKVFDKIIINPFL